jgi:hypothetical protein
VVLVVIGLLCYIRPGDFDIDPSMIELPVDRRIEDDELAAAVAEAIFNDRLNSGAGLPFQIGELLPRLGRRDSSFQHRFFSANGGREALDRRVAEYCWRLVVLGFLVPEGTAFAVTEQGRRFLAERADDGRVVLTSNGLVRRLGERCPKLDPVTSRYAGLAQECFLAAHYHASAVLLGVASEATLERLATCLERVLSRLRTHHRRRRDTAASTLDWLEDILRSRRKEIKKLLDIAGADSRWVDDISRLLGTGTAIRLTRNEAGHPTDAVIDRDDALGLFVLFPRMAEAAFVTAAALDGVTPN